MLMDGFRRTEIETSGARIVTVRGGSGPPLLLLHGNPFTHLSWHKFAPRLAQEFTVVATDLRGYGDSEKPAGGERHVNYSFRASWPPATTAAPACCTACASTIRTRSSARRFSTSFRSTICSTTSRGSG